MNLRKIRKNSFTLIETALSFCVLAIILLFLFSTLRSSTTLSAKIDLARELIFSRYHIHERLSHLLSHVESSIYSPIEQEKPPFYTELSSKDSSPILYFTVDNGIDPEEAFTGILYGKIYLDHHSLLLELQPINKTDQNKPRREILYNNVAQLSWYFYKRPSMIKTQTSSDDLEQFTTWSLDCGDIPYCATLSVLLDDSTSIEYSFYLSSKIQPIHYEL